MDTFFGLKKNCPEENGDDTASARSVTKASLTVGMRSASQRNVKYLDWGEDAYNALNDETFGAADQDDWEDIHEKLVRLERSKNDRTDSLSQEDEDDSTDQSFEKYEPGRKPNKPSLYDSSNKSGYSCTETQKNGDDLANKLRLGSSIWSDPMEIRSEPQRLYSTVVSPNVSQPLQPTTFGSVAVEQPIEQKKLSSLPGFRPPVSMLSLQDIEKNLIQTQRQSNEINLPHVQQHIAHQQQPPTLPILIPPPTPPLLMVSSLAGQPLRIAPILMKPPPPLMTARNLMFSPGLVPAPSLPLMGFPNPTQTGFQPYNLLARPLSTPINNFSMHSAFPPQPFGSPLQGLLGGPVPVGPPFLPRHPISPVPFLLQPNPAPPLQTNPLNQRLMQEIQQNHPLLAINRQLANTHNAFSNRVNNNIPQNNPMHNISNEQQYQQHQPQQQSLQQLIDDSLQRAGCSQVLDEYANMMTIWEKRWMIGIQLEQLNFDTPYISDYYFTVYKTRLAADKDENKKRTVEDILQNQPLAQPKDQPVFMMSLLANNDISALLNEIREQICFDSKSVCASDEQNSTLPENSLGRRNFGTLSAPRILIDTALMASDHANGNATTTVEVSGMQRKARHVLIVIEQLYKIVLDMEDLLNPIAIQFANQLREKRKREKMSIAGEVSDITAEASPECTGKSSTTDTLEATTSFDDLASSLIGQLSQDKITSIMGVRKGKNLLRRSLAVLDKDPRRWTIWRMVFFAVPCLPKKDREDADGLLLTLFDELTRQLRYGTSVDLLQMAKTISSNSKVMQCIVSNKFLLYCIITIIFQMEIFCGKNPKTLLEKKQNSSTPQKDWWISFLIEVNRTVKDSISPHGVGSLPISINVIKDNNIIRTLRVHFDRFKGQVVGTDLLNFITDNGNSDLRPGFARKQSFQAKD
ncbi:protein PAT1 homolog 1-like [Anopheles nili]|uniref:protein PAT1 homolog 1-like n=1 Tax=Anopheles nili TaxID=185578 RepID=UPI00237B25E3|nr:protein PAT1 homolog 1-like [Anopheles nili]